MTLPVLGLSTRPTLAEISSILIELLVTLALISLKLLWCCRMLSWIVSIFVARFETLDWMSSISLSIPGLFNPSSTFTRALKTKIHQMDSLWLVQITRRHSEISWIFLNIYFWWILLRQFMKLYWSTNKGINENFWKLEGFEKIWRLSYPCFGSS